MLCFSKIIKHMEKKDRKKLEKLSLKSMDLEPMKNVKGGDSLSFSCSASLSVQMNVEVDIEIEQETEYIFY